MTDTQPRQPSGTPAGGQWATATKGEQSDVVLTITAPRDLLVEVKNLDPAAMRAHLNSTGFAEFDHALELRDVDLEEALDKKGAIQAAALAAIAADPDGPDGQLAYEVYMDDVHFGAVEIAGKRRGPMCPEGHRWGFDAHCSTCCQPDTLRWNPRPMPNEIDPAYWRQRARDARRAEMESFDRSDTDGSLSQWSSGLAARQYMRQAEICENGGKSTFPALFDLDGNPVDAKLVKTEYGMSWRLNQPKADGSRWVNRSYAMKGATRTANMAKKGYREGFVWAPAKADLGGGGTGLSGALGVYVVDRRTDGGFDPNAEFAGWDDQDLLT